MSIIFYVPLKDNVKLAVYDLNPEGSKCIFMIHGWPYSEKIFEYQKNLLVEKGYRVLTMDLRGFGNSDTTSCGYNYNQFADDLFHVVRALSLRGFVLAGFSMGGAVALRYMSRYRGLGVKKLMLISTPAPSLTRRSDFIYGVNKEEIDGLIQQARTDRAALCEKLSQNMLAGSHSEAIVSWLKDIALSSSAIGTIQSAYSLRDEDLRQDMMRVCVPTAIYHGVLDEFVPYNLALLQSDCIWDSRLYTFENSGHLVLYDELEEFNHSFCLFLDNC